MRLIGPTAQSGSFDKEGEPLPLKRQPAEDFKKFKRSAGDITTLKAGATPCEHQGSSQPINARFPGPCFHSANWERSLFLVMETQ